MTSRAIAYVSDIILGGTGEVIGRDEQRQRIQAYAQEHDVEIVAWFEDEMYNEDILSRPGIQELLACEESCDTILVERVWAFSRRQNLLEGFFTEMERRKLSVAAATELWDCVSQMARRRFSSTLRTLQRSRRQVTRDDSKVRIRKPKRLNFVVLKKHPV